MAELASAPVPEELRALIGGEAYAVWGRFCAEIEALYDMQPVWNDGGKRWKYEYKYRRGGKTLCALYAAEARFGLLLIFGKDERERFEGIRPALSAETQSAYDEATTYHDGKWVLFSGRLSLEELRMLLALKRRPNRIAGEGR